MQIRVGSGRTSFLVKLDLFVHLINVSNCCFRPTTGIHFYYDTCQNSKPLHFIFSFFILTISLRLSHFVIYFLPLSPLASELFDPDYRQNTMATLWVGGFLTNFLCIFVVFYFCYWVHPIPPTFNVI